MINILHMPLYEAMFGKSANAMLEASTGISQRTWRAGGPKRRMDPNEPWRRAEKVVQRIEREGELPTEVIRRFADWLQTSDPAIGDFEVFIKYFELLGCREYPQTLSLARSLDSCNTALTVARWEGAPSNFRQTLEDLGAWRALGTWLNESGETEACSSLLKRLETARSWRDLSEVIGHLNLLAWCQLLACWDVETQEGPFWGKTSQPLCLWVQPGRQGEGLYRGRAPFRPPMSALIDTSFLLATGGKEPRRDMIAGKGGPVLMGHDSEQPLAKIRSGRRMLTMAEFDEVWCNFTRGTERREGAAPWLLFAAAHFFTLVFLTRDTTRGVRSQRVGIDRLYKVIWLRYLDDFKSRGASFATAPWPEHLKTV